MSHSHPGRCPSPPRGCLSPSLGVPSPCCRSLSQLQRILSSPWTSYLHTRGSTPALMIPIPALGVLSPPLGVPVPISRGSISTPGVPVTIPGAPIPSMVVPVPTPGVLSPPWGCCLHSQGSHPHPEGPSPGSCHPYPGDSVPAPGVPSPLWGPNPTWQGPRPHAGSACPHAGSPIPSLGILSQQSQMSAFPQSPPHTTSASGACPPLPPSLPIRYLPGLSAPRGFVLPLGTVGLAAGSPCGCSAPALPSVLPGGSPGWGSPGQGPSHCAFPTGMLPPCCPQGGWG